jgi:hypothetical protein
MVKIAQIDKYFSLCVTLHETEKILIKY